MEVAMVTDGRVKELRRLLGMGRTLADSARMAEMSEKTARTYRDDEGLPSQQKTGRSYRTRPDPFEGVRDEVQERLETEPKLKAKTLFEWVQKTHADEFPDSTRRTFERRVNKWRSLHGPGKTVFFSQEHHPGRLAASDFTVCNELGVKIAGQRFEHTFFHCVLTFSNVESVSLCFRSRLNRSVPAFRKHSGNSAAFPNGIAVILWRWPCEITPVVANSPNGMRL
jgi:hypothetical protein